MQTLFSIMDEEQEQIEKRINLIAARLRDMASHPHFNLHLLNTIETELTTAETELTEPEPLAQFESGQYTLDDKGYRVIVEVTAREGKITKIVDKNGNDWTAYHRDHQCTLEQAT